MGSIIKKARVPLARSYAPAKPQAPEAILTKEEVEETPRGCSSPIGCRGCITLIFVFLFLGCGLLMFTIIRRPPALWEPLKQVLNIGVNLPVTQKTDSGAVVLSKIEQAITQNGAVRLTESEASTLVADRLARRAYVDIEPGVVTAYVDAEQDQTLGPLWLVIEIKLTDKNEPYISRTGTGLIPAPQFLTNSVTDFVKNTVSASDQSVLGTIFNLGRGIKLSSINFDKDQLSADVKIDLSEIIPGL